MQRLFVFPYPMAFLFSPYATALALQNNLQVGGTIIRQRDDRKITVKNGWNGIGYTPMINLPVATALEDYYDKDQEYDVIKSHTEFAVFTVSQNKGYHLTPTIPLL